jgi:hypothetical protein
MCQNLSTDCRKRIVRQRPLFVMKKQLPVKNIAKPVGAYRVLMKPRITAVGKKGKLKRRTAGRRGATLAGAGAFFAAIIGLKVRIVSQNQHHLYGIWTVVTEFEPLLLLERRRDWKVLVFLLTTKF